MFRLEDIEYRVLALPPSGEGQRHIDLSDLIISCRHEELKDQLSSRVSLRVKQAKLDSGEWVSSQLYLANRIVLQYRVIPHSWEEIWRGSVYKFQHASESGTAIDLTCYDTLYPMQQSAEQIKVKKDETVSDTISRIAEKWGIPIGDSPSIDYAPGFQLYRGEKIGAILMNRLNKTRKQGEGGYVIRDVKGSVHVIEEGTNETGYILDREFLDGYTNTHSVENLVTRVKVFENSGEEDEPSKKIIQQDGRTEFGVVQEVIFGAEDKEDAEKQATEVLNERGEPEQERTLRAPDIPMLRKGDLIELELSTPERCIITSLSRDIVKQTMNLTVRTEGE